MHRKFISLVAICLLFIFICGFSLAAEVLIDVAASQTLWFFDLWGDTRDNIYTVGIGGAIYHYDGYSWLAVNSPALAANTADFYAVSGSSASCIFAVGKAGTAFYYNGLNWTKLVTGTNRDLRDVVCLAWNDAYAVGAGGLILHYNGENWSPLNAPTSRDLWGIWGNASNDLYTVGSYGVILHWNGNAWTTMMSTTTADLRSIWGVDNSAVYAVGALGTILKFDGVNWSAFNTTALGRLNLNDVCGFGAADVYAVGYHGQILHYDGVSWTFATSNHTYMDYNYFGIWGSCSSDLLAVGEGGIINHYDGLNWTEMRLPDNSMFWINKIIGRAYDDLYLAGYAGYIAHFDGATYTRLALPVSNDIYDLWQAPTGTEIFAVGTGGTILHYDGATWSVMRSNTSQLLYGVWGTDRTNVYAVGNNGTVLHYDGTIWQPVYTGFSVSFKKIWGLSAYEIYLVGNNGTLLFYNGSSWTPLSSGTTVNLNDIWGTSPTNLYVTGSSAVLLHYNGTTWSQVNMGARTSLFDIAGTDANNIYVAEETTGVIFHYDGISWRPITTPLLPDGTRNFFYTIWLDEKQNAFFGGVQAIGLLASLFYYHPANNDPPVMKPEIIPAAGTYYQPVTVQMSCTTPGSEIRYTMDGSEPATTSLLYSGPFTIMTCCTINARGYKNGAPESGVATSSYYLISDHAAPELISVRYINATALEVRYSEELERVSAEDGSHYSLDRSAVVLQASLGADQKTVRLIVNELGGGLDYFLTTAGVMDLYGNASATDSGRFTVPLSEPGLVGYWKFSEGVGTITTDCTTNQTQGLINGCEWTAAGRFGNALRFNGSSSVDLGISKFGIDTTNSFTVACWFYYEGTTGGKLISRGPYVNPFEIQCMSYNRLNVAVRTTNTVYRQDGTLRIQNGLWYHVALTFNSNGERILYINGVENLRQTLTGSLNFGVAGTVNHLLVGSGFTGIIDELKLYNRCLTATEISQLYTGN